MVGDVGPTSMCHITAAECNSCLLQRVVLWRLKSKFYAVMLRQKIMFPVLFEMGGTLIYSSLSLRNLKSESERWMGKALQHDFLHRKVSSVRTKVLSLLYPGARHMQ